MATTEYQSKEEYSSKATPPSGYKITGVTGISPEAKKKIEESGFGGGGYTPDTRLVQSGGGSAGGRSGYRVTGVTQPAPEAVKQVSQSAYGVQGGYKPDVRMGGVQVRVTSAPKAGPVDVEAYNVAQASAGELNRQLGGQQYFIVSQGPQGEYIVEQNPATTKQPGLTAQLKQMLQGGVQGRDVSVTEMDGKFLVRSTPQVPPAPTARPELKLGFTKAEGDLVDIQPKGTAQMSSPTVEIGMSRYPVSPQYATPSYGEEVVKTVTPAVEYASASPKVKSRTIAEAVAEASQANAPAPKETAKKFEIYTPTSTPEFMQTPIQQVYSMKLGESLRGSAMDALATTFGPGARELDKPVTLGLSPADVVFGAPGYAADIAFETIKTASVPTLYGKAAMEGAAFSIRESVATATGIESIRPTQQERDVAISDFASAVKYSPNVPVFVAFTAQAGATPTGPRMTIGQDKTVGAIRIRAGEAEFKSALGAPTKYDAQQLVSGKAKDVFIGRFEVGSQARGIVPVDALGNVGAGVGKPAPFSIEIAKGVVKGTADPYRLSLQESLRSGVTLAAYEAGVQVVTGQQIDPGRIVAAGVSGAVIIYPASKFISLGMSQPKAALPQSRQDTIPASYEVVQGKAVGGPTKTRLPDQFSNQIMEITPGKPAIPSGKAPAPYTTPAKTVTVEPGDFLIVGPQSTRPGPVGIQRRIMKYGQRTEVIELTTERQLQPGGGTQAVVVETETPVQIGKIKQAQVETPEQAFNRQFQGTKDVTRLTSTIKPQALYSAEVSYPPTAATAPTSGMIREVTQPVNIPAFTETQKQVTPIPPPPTPGQTIILPGEQPPPSQTNIFSTVAIPSVPLGFPTLFPPIGGDSRGERAVSRRTKVPGEAQDLLQAAISGPATGIPKPSRIGKKGPRSLLGF